MTGNGSDYTVMSDEALMAAIQKNDQAAFSELYDRFATRILQFLMRMLGNDREKARDFLQDVFLRVIRSADRYQPGRSAKTWIYTIAMNLCKNEYRRLSVRRNMEEGVDIESLPNEARDPGNQFDLRRFQAALDREIDKLPGYLRSTFLLRFQSGLSVREISDIMDCSQGTVKSRLFYMIKNLAENLKSYNPYNIEAI